MRRPRRVSIGDASLGRFKPEWDFPTYKRLLMPFRATCSTDIYQPSDVPYDGDLRGRLDRPL